MRTLEDFMNRLTDMDSGWWPFLYLRPETSQLMDNRILLKMSIYFGPLYGAILSFLPVLFKRAEFSLSSVVASAVIVTILFFPLYKYTFALFWNRRARRLQAQTHEPSAT